MNSTPAPSNEARFLNCDSGAFDQFKEPGKKYQILEATTEGMNASALNDVKQKDLMLCRELNPSDWEKELKENTRGFIIVTKDQIFHRDITGYDPTTKIISCQSRSKESESNILQLKLEYSQIFEVEKVSG